MNEVQDYIKLPLRSLEKKKHVFEFSLNADFFLRFQHPDINGGNANVTITVEKLSNYMNVVVDFSGELVVSCDRCLDDLAVPVEGENILSVRFAEAPEEQENEEEDLKEDVMYVDGGDEELDLTHYVYESICLALPIQRVHGNDKNGKSLCNPNMLKYLLNAEENKRINSPFGILKDLNINILNIFNNGTS